jgi:hypothetical protein
MQEEARRLNPDFLFELSIWDGNIGNGQGKPTYYQSLGQTWDTVRYAGYVQFGMWLLRPSVVREYRGTLFPTAEGIPYLMSIVGAVDRITLSNFWRNGTLVPNTFYPHPYQIQIPDRYVPVNRNYMLTVNVNPLPPWQLNTKIQVFAIALSLGVTPNRRWLVYAHSPLGDIKNVSISLPQYNNTISMDVSRGGSVVVVSESNKTVTPIS